jgi:hypothetical protein
MPKCRQVDSICENAKGRQKHKGRGCRPVTKVYFDTEASGEGKPFPLNISVAGQVQRKLDLAVMASHLGVTVDDLCARAHCIPEPSVMGQPSSWVWISESVEEAYGKLNKFLSDVVAIESESNLKVRRLGQFLTWPVTDFQAPLPFRSLKMRN